MSRRAAAFVKDIPGKVTGSTCSFPDELSEIQMREGVAPGYQWPSSPDDERGREKEREREKREREREIER